MESPIVEAIVIADECGDSLWEAVLEQEEKVDEIKNISKTSAPLPNSIDAVQECDASNAE